MKKCRQAESSTTRIGNRMWFYQHSKIPKSQIPNARNSKSLNPQVCNPGRNKPSEIQGGRILKSLGIAKVKIQKYICRCLWTDFELIGHGPTKHSRARLAVGICSSGMSCSRFLRRASMMGLALRFWVTLQLYA